MSTISSDQIKSFSNQVLRRFKGDLVLNCFLHDRLVSEASCKIVALHQLVSYTTKDADLLSHLISIQSEISASSSRFRFDHGSVPSFSGEVK